MYIKTKVHKYVYIKKQMIEFFCIHFFKEIKIIKTSVGTLSLFYVGLLEIEWNRKIDYEKNDNVSLPLHYNLLKLKAFYKCFSYSVNKIRLIYSYHWINQKYIFISCICIFG